MDKTFNPQNQYFFYQKCALKTDFLKTKKNVDNYLKIQNKSYQI